MLLILDIIEASFVSYIDKILALKLDIFVIICLNNIMIYSNKKSYSNYFL